MADEPLRCGDLVVDLVAHEAFVDDVPLGLSHLQFVLLSCLVSHADRVVTRDELRTAAAAIGTPTNRTITSTLSRVRARLGHGPRRPVISAARSRGYQLTMPVPTARV
jgi:DNA-binding response OmpR family regulator